MQKELEIIIGHPFECEWPIDYDIFDEDKLDTTIPFIIKDSSGQDFISLEFNNGITIIKFDDEETSQIVASIYETDMFPEGTYSYSFSPKTFSGKDLGTISGKIIASKDKSNLPAASSREVRPWDLLRSKSTPEGERATEEKRQERLSICEECPRYIKFTSQCLECGCIMKLKTKLEAATCPLGKW